MCSDTNGCSGSYYEHYYIFLKFNSTQETFSIKHHTIPFFIPLDGAVKKYLNSNFKLFLEKIKHYLNSYVARREQVAHLSECTAIGILNLCYSPFQGEKATVNNPTTF